MNYSVLVMETPEDCDHCLIGCPHWNDDGVPFPPTCPLRTLQKKDEGTWNDCIADLESGRKL